MQKRKGYFESKFYFPCHELNKLNKRLTFTLDALDLNECNQHEIAYETYFNAKQNLYRSKVSLNKAKSVPIAALISVWVIYFSIKLSHSFYLRFHDPIKDTLSGVAHGAIGILFYFMIGIIPLAISIALGIWFYVNFLR